MKHIAIALGLLATLAIEAQAEYVEQADPLSEVVGTWNAHGLAIGRSAHAAVSAGPTPSAYLGMGMDPLPFGRKGYGVTLDVQARGGYGATLRLWLADVLVENEAAPHIAVDRPSARAYTHSCFLAMVGRRLVSFDITETDEMDLDVEATGRSKIVLVDPRTFRIIDTAPAFSRIDGTAHATITGGVRVQTRGVYAVSGLEFFDGTLTARNLAANENTLLVNPDEGAWIDIDPVSMYLYLMARPYRQLLARVVAPSRHRSFVWSEWPA
jgi:hypothetical protein